MVLSLAIAVILAITLHEAAHGYAAWALGDDTAKKLGRLSLNPIVHVDRMGTIVLPGFLLASQLLFTGHISFLFGWAKPVPVAAWKFAHPRRGMMIVAVAGPAMNFLLAWLAAVAIYGLDILPQGASKLAEDFLNDFILVNLVLGLFNLLPIPPLDGGRIVVGLLPERLAMAWAKVERFGIVIVLLLVFLIPEVARSMGTPFNPIQDTLNRILPWASDWVLRLSGHGQFS
jgi:Zn-dependent protease